MKKNIFITLVAVFTIHFVSAQTTDNTIYEAPDAPAYPLLNLCKAERHTGWNTDSVRACGEYNLMRLMAQNIRYPEEAREANLQGTVVTRLLVEPDGKVSKIDVLKDIGGGCAPEALRVLRALDSLGLRWEPAQVGGKVVRSYKVLPFRFRLTEALPYILTDRQDTIYTNIDQQPEFRGGVDSMYRYVINRLEYPSAYRDSCKNGVVELSLIVAPNGRIRIENQLDFNNLGMDFQFKAIQLANRTSGLWTPATYKNRPVPATATIRTLFQSDAPGCKTANEKFNNAMLLADEAAILNETGKATEAIAKFNQAIALDPNNTELLYYRGTLLLNDNQKEAACADYNQIKAILGTTWFEGIRRVVCGW